MLTPGGLSMSDIEFVQASAGFDPCRYVRQHGLNKLQRCQNFETCRDKCMACSRFNTYLQNGAFRMEAPTKPSRFWYFKCEIDRLPEGHRCCKKCDTVKSIDHFSVCGPDDGRRNTCRQCMKGDRSDRCKLSPQSVDEIRVKLAAGHTLRALGMEYGVSRSTICHISTGRTWAA